MASSGEPLIFDDSGAVFRSGIKSGKILFFVVAKSPA